MRCRSTFKRLAAWLIVSTAATAAFSAAAIGDSVTTKNGVVYRGVVDKDNTLVSILDADGLKRIVIRDTKIDRIASEKAERGETFDIVQEMTVHTGAMPEVVLNVTAGPWNNSGRRSFSYYVPRLKKPYQMTQAIYRLSPFSVKVRGVDGFWKGQVSTSAVPKDVVLAILSKVDSKHYAERRRVIRFLIQAGWLPEALAEVKRLVTDFPKEVADPVQGFDSAGIIRTIQDAEARQRMAEIDVLTKAQRPGAALALLKTFPSEGVDADVLVAVRNQLRKVETRATADRKLAEAVRLAADGVPPELQAELRPILLEILTGLADAPDAVRSRLEGFEKDENATASPGTRFAFAASGWLVGGEAAVGDLKAVAGLVQARRAIEAFLKAPIGDARAQTINDLKQVDLAGKPLDPETLTRIIQNLAPPMAGKQEAKPGKPVMLRVRDDPNPEQPTEYAVLLPPEYHPLRNYPTVVVLHGPETAIGAIDWWSAEAQRRGFIVIAPEYALRGQSRSYHYSTSEHAAVTLAIRDARRRFAIDPDRTFIGGQLDGAFMAWDFGLAHPDLFAGIVSISGLPQKYVWPYRVNLPRVPLYLVVGDLAPLESDVVYEKWAKPQIIKNLDITYIEYYARGLEPFPEEAPAVFDWMGPRKREAVPKTFDFVAGREGDDREHGIVIREFAAGRTLEPEVIDDLGANLKPASFKYTTSKDANLLNLNTSGVRKLDVWLSPRVLDFSKRITVRVNGKDVLRTLVKPDLGAMLDDIRFRGDRQQIYWFKLPVNVGGNRG